MQISWRSSHDGQRVCRFVYSLHRESQKRPTILFVHNFGKCWPIFKNFLIFGFNKIWQEDSYHVSTTRYITLQNLICHFLPRKAATLVRSWDRNSVRPSVCLSVCLSDTLVLCDKTKQYIAEILTFHEKVINLVHDTKRDWWAMSPSP